MDTRQKITDFFASFPSKTFTKHDLLIYAGEPIERIFLLEDGRVNQYDITDTGTEVVVNTFKPGAFFPASAALVGNDNSFFFEAATPLRVRAAPTQAVAIFLRNNPDVALDLLTRVYRGTDGLLKRMALLMGGDATKRVVFEVLNVAYRLGEPTADNATYVAIQEGEIAKRAGLARETVNRELKKLKEQHLVDVTRTGITIRDITKLESLLNGESY